MNELATHWIWCVSMLSCQVWSDSFVTPWIAAHQAPLSMISQARIQEWVAISFSRGSSWPRDQTCISCLGRRILFHWATWEVHWIWTIEQKKIQEWSWFPAYGTNWIVVCFSRVEARPRLGRTYLLLRSRKQNLENLNFPFKEGFFLSKPQNLLTASVGNKHGECPSLNKCFFNLIPS